MLGTEEELMGAGVTQQAYAARGMLWPHTQTNPYVYEVPYVIADAFSSAYVTTVIQPGIDHWNNETNIQFVERTDEVAYVEFVAATGKKKCNSLVGRQDERQDLNLDPDWCQTVSTVVHELGHVVGLYHEQSRSDRDQYVEIHEENIKPGKEHNFEIVYTGQLLGPYGYDSVMHYRTTAFGKEDGQGNQATTITSLGNQIAPSNWLSADDIASLEWLYPPQDLPLVRCPPGFQRVNLLVLLFVGLVAYGTSVLVEYGDHAAAVILYATVIACIGFAQASLWRYARARGLLEARLDNATFGYIVLRALVVPVIFAASIPFALANADLAKYIWILALLAQGALWLVARSATRPEVGAEEGAEA